MIINYEAVAPQWSYHIDSGCFRVVANFVIIVPEQADYIESGCIRFDMPVNCYYFAEYDSSG